MDLQGQGFDYLIVTLFKPYSTSKNIQEYEQLTASTKDCSNNNRYCLVASTHGVAQDQPYQIIQTKIVDNSSPRKRLYSKEDKYYNHNLSFWATSEEEIAHIKKDAVDHTVEEEIFVSNSGNFAAIKLDEYGIPERVEHLSLNNPDQKLKMYLQQDLLEAFSSKDILKMSRLSKYYQTAKPMRVEGGFVEIDMIERKLLLNLETGEIKAKSLFF